MRGRGRFQGLYGYRGEGGESGLGLKRYMKSGQMGPSMYGSYRLYRKERRGLIGVK